MKRFWIGIVLLAVLLAAGLAGTLVMDRFHGSLALRLDAVKEAALAEDWDTARAILAQCHSRWTRCRNGVAALASHEPIEEIDSLYAQLNLYLLHRDREDFALCCTMLRYKTAALGEAQGINWWNLL